MTAAGTAGQERWGIVGGGMLGLTLALRLPGLTTWTSEDLNILASLFVNSMIVIAEAIEDAGDQGSLDEIKRVAVKQLRMITVGVTGWRSSP